MRTLTLDQFTKCCPISHIDDMRTVCHLMTRRIGVAIHRDGFNPQSLECDDHLLAEFATAEQHDPGG